MNKRSFFGYVYECGGGKRLVKARGRVVAAIIFPDRRSHDGKFYVRRRALIDRRRGESLWLTFPYRFDSEDLAIEFIENNVSIFKNFKAKDW
jgi:hypothetical protein